MKIKNIIYLLLIIFPFFSCDNIDDLTMIAGFGSFEMLITSPAENDEYHIGNDCIIKWELSREKAKNVKLELLKEEEVVQVITPKTENDGEFLWEKIEGTAFESYNIRLSITEGPYSGKSCECGLFLLNPSVDQIIHFKDSNLEKAIRDRIDKPSGYIYKNDVKTITELFLQNKQISDITGLEYFTILEELNLHYNDIKDLNPLSELTSLKVLILSSNDIQDISYLSQLFALEKLSLEDNYIEVISSLYNLTSLKELKLSVNEIEDISFLDGMDSLESVYLRNNKIKNISLTNLSSLEFILLTHNLIENISLSGLPSLLQLLLGDNLIENITLTDLPSLWYIDLRENNNIKNKTFTNLPSLRTVLLDVY